MVGGGCIKDEKGKIVVEEERVRDVWAACYEKLLKEEFDWNRNDLIDADVVGPGRDTSYLKIYSETHKCDLRYSLVSVY